MNNLWAPWRSKFIYSRKHKGCIFCGNKKNGKTDKRYIVEKSELSFSMLNLYPYNNGHVMVAPFRHVKDFNSLTDKELLDMMKLVRKTISKIEKKLKPRGFNIGVNLGKVSGAGFAGHLHVHIVPRWVGDTNFMPVISNTKVVPESLKSMQSLLKAK